MTFELKIPCNGDCRDEDIEIITNGGCPACGFGMRVKEPADPCGRKK